MAAMRPTVLGMRVVAEYDGGGGEGVGVVLGVGVALELRGGGVDC